MNTIVKITALAGLAVAASAASASPLVLTFEGLANGYPVGNFYAAQGVSFSPATLALIDSDAGGTGNFANEPSPSTIMFFTDANNAILNYAAGFDTGFSFYYTSSTAAPVMVYDGLDGTGNLLATINLTAQFADNCTGDPFGQFCNFSNIGVSFNGIAKSVNFGGTANQTGYDNITFGSAVAGSGTPEPAAWALMIVGFGLVGTSLRRRAGLVAA